MRVRPPWEHRRRPNADDQALPLINIAFLLLVFFLMAGTLVLPEPFSVEHLSVRQGESAKPYPQVLAISQDGRLAYRGEIIAPDDLNRTLFADLDGPLPVKVDAQADAQFVIAILRRLGRAGVVEVRLMGLHIAAP